AVADDPELAVRPLPMEERERLDERGQPVPWLERSDEPNRDGPCRIATGFLANTKSIDVHTVRDDMDAIVVHKLADKSRHFARDGGNDVGRAEHALGDALGQSPIG